MKHQKTIKKISLAVLLILPGSALLAQQSVHSSGGNASGTGGSSSFSIGQTVYTTNTGSNGLVAQGVQHAYEIFAVGISEISVNFSLLVFPNPTTDGISIGIGNYQNEALEFQLFDLQGKLLDQGSIDSAETLVDMQNLATASYMLNVYQNGKIIQSFKIVKQ
jgi:hypothetical protein